MMKRLSMLALALAFIVSPAVAQLSAVFSYSTFYQNEVGPYLETYVSFDAWKLNFVQKGSDYQATVEVLLTISKDDSIEVAKKYDLNSPKIKSPTATNFNFLDVQRFALGNGIHDLTLSVRDKNSESEATVVTEKLIVYFDAKKPSLSSVQMMASVKPTVTENILSRNGYDMEPYVSDFLPAEISHIDYYFEIYNINNETRDDYVYVLSYIERQDNGRPFTPQPYSQRLENGAFIPVFGSMDITALPSGNYNLVVEVVNRHNDKLLYKKVPFFRSNPDVAEAVLQADVSATFAGAMNDESALDEYIEALYPIANEQERTDIYALIRQRNLQEKQEFLYRFWVRREAIDPESAWLDYKERVDYVNANFSWPRTKGIHTDRGRVYLQYGPPDYIRDEKNFVANRNLGSGVRNPGVDYAIQSASNKNQGQIFYLPYQLWRYNNIPGDDANRCFIFWDQFRSGFYKLLHSNARGEVRDAKWEQVLSQQQLNEEEVGEVGAQFERGY